MAEQQLIRRTLEQQKLKEQLQREKQILLFGNPSQFQPKSARKHNIQDKHSSLFPNSIHSKSIYKYVPAEIDSKIAEKGAEAILNTWTHENQYFPDNVILRSIQRQSKKTSFQKELTPLGKENMEEILMEARQALKKREKPSIKEKYQSRNYKKQQMQDPFEQITIEEKAFQ